MMKGIFEKVMWVGKATTFGVGLTVMLALVFGVATVALAAVPGDPFKLGQSNTINKISTLVGSASTAMLRIDNNGTGPALDLRVEPGTDPLTVNSNEEVDKLRAANATRADSASSTDSATNADKLDGNDSTAFIQGAWALVDPNGNLVRGKGALSASTNATGNYFVQFDRDITNCALIASIGVDGAVYTQGNNIEAHVAAGDPTYAQVRTYDEPNGGLAARGFYLAVLC
jgi:hypothetical protein